MTQARYFETLEIGRVEWPGRVDFCPTQLRWPDLFSLTQRRTGSGQFLPLNIG